MQEGEAAAQDWTSGNVCDGARPLQPVRYLVTVRVAGIQSPKPLRRVVPPSFLGGETVRVGGKVRVKLLCRTVPSLNLGM